MSDLVNRASTTFSPALTISLMILFAIILFGALSVPFGNKRALLVLIPILVFLTYRLIPDWTVSVYIFVPLIALWVVILLGAARISVWEMRECSDRAGDWWTLPHILGILSAVAVAAFITWMFIAVPALRQRYLDFVDVNNGYSLIFLPLFTCGLVFGIVNGVLSSAVSPLFSRDPHYCIGKLEDFFCIRVGYSPYGGNNRYYVVKFEGSPYYWRVSWNNFRRFVEHEGTVYKYTVVRGLFKMHFMRHKPEVEQPISESQLSENRKRWQFLRNNARTSRIRNGLGLGAFIFIFFMSLIDILIVLGIVVDGETMHDPLTSYFIGGIIAGIVSIILIVVFIVRLVRVRKTDIGEPLPHKYKIDYRAVKAAYKQEHSGVDSGDYYHPDYKPEPAPEPQPVVYDNADSPPQGESDEDHSMHIAAYDEHKDDPYNPPEDKE